MEQCRQQVGAVTWSSSTLRTPRLDRKLHRGRLSYDGGAGSLT